MMLLHVAITLCALVTLTSALRVERDDLWTSFKVRHNKTYDSWSDVIRRSIWEYNLDQIERHNIEESRGLHTYTMGENHFSDKTDEELHKMMSRPAMPHHHHQHHFSFPPPPTNMSDILLPPQVDWRKEGILTPVKDQGHCGSCWAFAATGALEAQWARKTGRLVGLSEQNLVDCSWGYGNQGCDGGYPFLAFNYIIDNSINTEASYPYTGHDGEMCRFNKSSVGATMRAAMTQYLDGNSKAKAAAMEDVLATLVAELGPVVAVMDVAESLFRYNRGVYKDNKCSSIIDEFKSPHAVLVVGYGTGSEGDYWIVRNSWSASWGDGGYFNIARHSNMCGIATLLSVPEV